MKGNTTVNEEFDKDSLGCFRGMVIGLPIAAVLWSLFFLLI